MNWINNVVRPRISGLLTKRRDPPEDFWHKCPACGQMTDKNALIENQHVFPCCNHHGRMTAPERMAALFDGGTYKTIATKDAPLDPLKFRDSKRYTDRVKDAKTSTTMPCAVLVAEGTLDTRPVVSAAHDARFMSGSLATSEGEAIITGMLRAVEKKCAFILFAASGGARMQEGILSLMQMPRTTIAVQRLRDAGLPYLVVLTDPTTGGVTASYAMLGDIHIAEPNALICFAGPRVIQQTIREQLPDGFQRAEYLFSHGMIDMVTHRHELRATLSRLVTLLGPRPLALADKKSAKTLATKANGKALNGANGHANGAVANGHAEPEPVDGDERLDPARIDAKERAKRELEAKAKGRALPPGTDGRG